MKNSLEENGAMCKCRIVYDKWKYRKEKSKNGIFVNELEVEEYIANDKYCIL